LIRSQRTSLSPWDLRTKGLMTQDSDDDTWYPTGLSFECTGCGNCCSGPSTGYVWIDDSEIQRLADHLEIKDLDLFEKRFVRTVGARRSLVEYSDGDCIFLDPQTRRCSVYAARPRQCRTWPFWSSNLESPQPALVPVAIKAASIRSTRFVRFSNKNPMPRNPDPRSHSEVGSFARTSRTRNRS
jgi:Fe-S-cluster containining protein